MGKIVDKLRSLAAACTLVMTKSHVNSIYAYCLQHSKKRKTFESSVVFKSWKKIFGMACPSG